MFIIIFFLYLYLIYRVNTYIFIRKNTYKQIKKIMKTTILISFILFFHSFSFAQTTAYDASENYGTVQANSGTYQLMTTNTKANEVFTNHLLYFIEAKREIENSIVLKIGNYTYVRILPLNLINSANFSPLPEGIIEITLDETIIATPKTKNQ